MRRLLLIGSSLVTALAASLCCILPLVAAAGGVALLGTAAVFEAWRPYLLILTGLLLAAGAFTVYRDYRRGCERGGVCEGKPVTRWSVVSLAVIAALAVSLALFPYYSGSVAHAMATAGNVKDRSGVNLRTIRFGVAGMTCPPCAKGLEASFRNMPGVKQAKVDYDAKQATVSFDTSKQTERAITKVVTDAGYRVTGK
jgi:mercuric ion transport protein